VVRLKEANMAVHVEDDHRRGSFADGQASASAGEGPRGRFSTGQERADRPRVVDRGHTRGVTARNDRGGRRP
jgi:hypothetical protein